jgi:tetratricopeptide (TPR) repeat protein
VNFERFTSVRVYTTPGFVKLCASPRHSQGFTFLITLAEQIRAWDLGQEQVGLYGILLGKLDQHMDAICLRGLGHGYRSLSQDQRAQASLRQSLALFQALGEISEVAWTLYWLGICLMYAYTDLDVDDAHQCLVEALQEFRRLQDDKGIAYTTHNLGHLMMTGGAYNEARQYFEESLSVHLQTLRGTEIVERGWSHLTFGRFLGEQGEYREAQKHLRRGWVLFRQLRNEHGLAWSLQCLGTLMLHRGKYQTARLLLMSALKLFQTSPWVHHDLGRIALRTKDYVLAHYHFQAMLLIQQNSSPYNSAVALALAGLARQLHSVSKYNSPCRFLSDPTMKWALRCCAP